MGSILFFGEVGGVSGKMAGILFFFVILSIGVELIKFLIILNFNESIILSFCGFFFRIDLVRMLKRVETIIVFFFFFELNYDGWILALLLSIRSWIDISIILSINGGIVFDIIL